MMRQHFRLWVVLAASLIGSAAHAAGGEDYDPHDSQRLQGDAKPRAAPQGETQAAADSVIAAWISAANRFEIMMAKIAAERARSPDVLEFAREMCATHERSENRLRAVLLRAGMKLEEGRVTAMLTGQSKLIASHLRKQSAEKFDRAFLVTHVITHRFALRMLDEQLIPRVRNEALKEELIRVRDEAARHLERARSIYAKIAGGEQGTGRPQGRASE